MTTITFPLISYPDFFFLFFFLNEKCSAFKGEWNLLLVSMHFHFQDQNESAAILKIKESMQEEAKRFEKDQEQPDYFMS